MPTKHTTRDSIADEIDDISYNSFDGSAFADGYGVKTREREFTKPELITIHNHLCEGFGLNRKLDGQTLKKTARFRLRLLMNDAGYRGFGRESHDGNPLRARELLTILTAVRDANENLRWVAEADAATDGGRR
jgi:hypothetical protein